MKKKKILWQLLLILSSFVAYGSGGTVAILLLLYLFFAGGSVDGRYFSGELTSGQITAFCIGTGTAIIAVVSAMFCYKKYKMYTKLLWDKKIDSK